MFRYGDPNFDKDYMTWGFHNPDKQIEEADSVLKILNSTKPLFILDLACGLGTHAIRWAKEGHHVTAVDLSQTFIDEGAKRAEMADVHVVFQVSDVRDLECKGCFDVVTWVEGVFFDDEAALAINKYLVEGGLFIHDVRNPENPKFKQLSSNWGTWREEKGIFHLESHQTDDSTGFRTNEWIEIDPANERIVRRYDKVPVPKRQPSQILESAGFSKCEYRTMSGEPFQDGEEPYWLWALARKEKTL